MAEKYEICCPDCASTNLKISGPVGNGLCGKCKGKGEYYDETDRVLSVLTLTDIGKDEEDYIKVCEDCNGEKQCQTCGGNGFIKVEYSDWVGDSLKELLDGTDDSNTQPKGDTNNIPSDKSHESNEDYTAYYGSDHSENSDIITFLSLIVLLIIGVCLYSIYDNYKYDKSIKNNQLTKKQKEPSFHLDNPLETNKPPSEPWDPNSASNENEIVSSSNEMKDDEAMSEEVKIENNYSTSNPDQIPMVKLEEINSSNSIISYNGTIDENYSGNVTIEPGLTVTLGSNVLIKGDLIVGENSTVTNQGIIRGNVYTERAKFINLGGSVNGLIYNGEGY